MEGTVKPDTGRKISVMGIVNLTADSYYASSRCLGKDGSTDVPAAVRMIGRMFGEGADIVDIGACSTRPGASVVSAQEEWRRLAPLMEVLRKEFPGKTFSIDTFRAETVKRCFDSIGDFIVNDISAGEDSPDMLGTVGQLSLTYIAMHKRGTPDTMQNLCSYEDVVVLARKNGETELPKPPAPREYRLNLHPDQAGVLIGLSFRLTLRELILSAARRELLPPGTVKTPYSWFNRAAFYKEIDRFNGMDYVEKFVQARHPELSLETMRTRSGLRSSAEFLSRSPEIRVLHNADDPILDQEDIRFLNETLKERITWFDCGGHMGNLALKEYQQILLRQLR